MNEHVQRLVHEGILQPVVYTTLKPISFQQSTGAGDFVLPVSWHNDPAGGTLHGAHHHPDNMGLPLTLDRSPALMMSRITPLSVLPVQSTTLRLQTRQPQPEASPKWVDARSDAGTGNNSYVPSIPIPHLRFQDRVDIGIYTGMSPLQRLIAAETKVHSGSIASSFVPT